MPKLVLLTPGGATRGAVEAAVAEFVAEYPGVRVQVVNTPGRDYYVKSLTMLAGRAQVDVLWMGQGFGIFAGRGALLDLNPWIREDTAFDLSAYNAQVVDWYRQGDGLYGIPYGVDVLAIAYNQDLFDAAGVPYPSSDWTLKELLAAARQLSRWDARTRRTEVAGLGFLNLDYRYYGLSFLSEEPHRFALNTGTGREWLQRNVDLIYEERILQRGTDLESIDRLTGFLNQQVAMIEIATWDIAEMRNRAMFRWDIVAVPTGRSGGRIGWASSAGFCIARNTRHPELAWTLLKRLSGEPFQRSMLQATIPTLEALSAEYLQAHPAPPEHLAELVKMVDHAQPDARIAAFQEVEAEWMYWRDQALLRRISVEEALKEAESNINRILDLHREEAP